MQPGAMRALLAGESDAAAEVGTPATTLDPSLLVELLDSTAATRGDRSADGRASGPAIRWGAGPPSTRSPCAEAIPDVALSAGAVPAGDGRPVPRGRL